MATFTMELWEVLELNGDPGFTEPDSDAAGGTIGLGRYPIFDEAHRKVLNEKIIERYWDREIGMETISKFQLAMRRKMNEIMPFYNKMYLTELVAIDPLLTFKLTTTRNGTGTSSSTQNTSMNETNSNTSNTDTDTTSHAANTSKSNSKSQQSDTPQNELPDDWETNADYATTGAASQANSNATADTTGNTTGNTTGSGTAATTGTGTGSGTTATTDSSSTSGYQGSPADLIIKFCAQILNIDVAILNDLNGLFMGIWDSGNEHQPVYPLTFGVSSEVFRPSFALESSN